MRILVIFIFNFVVLSAVFAEGGKDCAILNKDDARLRCYDLIFKTSNSTIDAADAGNWIVQKDVSKLDDTTNVFLRISSIGTFKEKFGGNKSVTIEIACRENRTSFYFVFGGAFMTDHQGGGAITVRIDRNKAYEKSFRISSDNRALGLWSGGPAIPFIKKLFGKEKLLIRFAPYNESYSTVEFGVSGIKNAIAPLAKACNWQT